MEKPMGSLQRLRRVFSNRMKLSGFLDRSELLISTKTVFQISSIIGTCRA